MIEVRGLRFGYRGVRKRVLDDISFEVRPGEIFGFLGPSGAGKSTTQKILIGLLGGYTGEVRVFGQPLARLGRGYYERIGVSWEVPNLYGKLTGRENLELFASLYFGPTADIDHLLALVDLADVADERASNYSKGMRMRLNFCRSLLRDPQILFLDEPTLGQDPENARRLRDLIQIRRKAGTTVFLTTHDMTAAAELCDRVGFLVDGRILLVDSPRNLMVQHGQRRVRVELVGAAGIERREFDLDGLGRNSEFLGLLRRGPVETIHTLEATLEDVFLAVTGRKLA